MDRHIKTPITEEMAVSLTYGDYVFISGSIYVARDAAHQRMIEALNRGEGLPLLSKCIRESKIVCYEDLGAEAVLKIEVERFPAIVVIDCEGRNLYERRDSLPELTP